MAASTALTPDLLDELMGAALEQAQKSVQLGEVPVGAVVAVSGQILGRAHNLTESNHDATAHAEILAMRQASQKLNNWRLSDAILCITLEPCTMCAGAIRLARIPVIVFGADDPRAGACGSLYDLSLDLRLGAEPRIIRGVRADECADILSKFFQARRS